MSHTYEYPRPSVTVDCVVFGLGAGLEVLLVRRGDEPFKGSLALPGGFVEVRDSADQGESLEAAAARELAEETGAAAYLEQLYTFGEPGRDPRGRVVSVAYYALMRSTPVRAGSDASEARWVPVGEALAGPLAFDHEAILKMALGRLEAKVRYAPVGFELLPERFTLRQLQDLYEMLLRRPLDKANFRRRVRALGVLRRAGVASKRTADRGPKAQLYRFDKRAYAAAEKRGVHFEI